MQKCLLQVKKTHSLPKYITLQWPSHPAGSSSSQLGLGVRKISVCCLAFLPPLLLSFPQTRSQLGQLWGSLTGENIWTGAQASQKLQNNCKNVVTATMCAPSKWLICYSRLLFSSLMHSALVQLETAQKIRGHNHIVVESEANPHKHYLLLLQYSFSSRVKVLCRSLFTWSCFVGQWCCFPSSWHSNVNAFLRKSWD